ncbi:MAG: S8 family peptidase [Mesonia sp.]|uniref:S8 family peptidase n=1 Tax=Mesonia sp. TaxID=1960830 RepID=UPI003F960995
MKKVNHILKRRVYHFGWYKWLSIGLFILLLLCLFLKCCSGNGGSVESDSKEHKQDTTRVNKVVTPLKSINTPENQVPKQLIRLRPIDTTRIEQIDDDPLGRYAINDLINIYLKENTEIDKFISDFQKKLPNDTIITNYYAEAYKRVQFSVNKKRKGFIKDLAKSDSTHVKFVTNEWVFQRQQSKNDPDFDTYKNFWFYDQIGVFDAWETTKGNPDVKIAVLDDGFDLQHVELVNNYVTPWNVFDYSDNVYATPKVQYHGTHVAGTIAAEDNNNFGIAGVAPNCRIIPVQISNESGIITTTSLLDGIFYALKNDAKIINISIAMRVGSITKSLSLQEQKTIAEFSFIEEQELWDEVFKIVKEENAIIVQAAGNENVIASIDPMKRSENTIIVGATNEKGERASFSNKGDEVDVYAPGTNVYSTLPNNKMGYLDGTSMASPIVAGCVGLVLSVYPNLTIEEVISLFTKQRNLNIPFNVNDLISKSI